MVGRTTLGLLHRWTAFLVALLLSGRPIRSSALEAQGGAATRPRVEVVFVLDTTGSMSGLLQAAKEQIWSIATDLACARPAPELRLGLVAFRDRGDAYVTRRMDLTSDLDALYTELIALYADGGGDEPESVNQALNEAITAIGWSTDAETYRAIFLIGDAPPHLYGDDVKYPLSCQLARARGIAVNTIQCGENKDTTPVWGEIAQLGDGAFARLDQNGGTPAIATPYDKGIAIMAKQLDGTRLTYGTDAERAALEERRGRAEQIYDRSSLGAQASRGLFNVTSTGRTNLYGSKDLLADWQCGAVKLDAIDSAQLPEPLRSMTAEERRAFLQRQAKLREDLELTLKSLAEQRADYVAKELAKRGAAQSSLTARLFSAMQPQAKRHGLELGSCASAAR